MATHWTFVRRAYLSDDAPKPYEVNDMVIRTEPNPDVNDAYYRKYVEQLEFFRLLNDRLHLFFRDVTPRFVP